MSYNKINDIHNIIRTWNTEQLIENLENNGLGDCCNAIRDKEIDGESFLKLTKVNLELWRHILNKTQITRLNSIIQLVHERPSNFVKSEILLAPTPQPNQPSKQRTQIDNKIKTIATLLAKEDNLPNDETVTIINKKKPILPVKPSVRPLPPIPTDPEPSPEVQQTNTQPPINVPEEATISEANVSTLHSAIKQSKVFRKLSREETVSEQINLASNTNNNTRPVPQPSAFSRPLPIPPIEKDPYPLPPNLRPPPIKVQTTNCLPRPPAFTVPSLNLESIEIEEDEEFEYDYTVDPDLYNYKNQYWYLDIDRNEAERLLKGTQNGTFLVRPSKYAKYECSISINYDNRTYHLAVTKNGDKFSLGQNEFVSINAIVDKYCNERMILNGPENEDIPVILKKMKFR